MKHKILVIDDDHDDLEMMQDIFNTEDRTDHSMMSSAKQMINYLDKIQSDADLPKLIMTDYFLPGMNGAEILKDLKSNQRYKEIEVLVYSSSYIDSIITICEGLGASAFLRKPATVSEYQHMLDTALSLIEEKNP